MKIPVSIEVDDLSPEKCSTTCPFFNNISHEDMGIVICELFNEQIIKSLKVGGGFSRVDRCLIGLVKK